MNTVGDEGTSHPTRLRTVAEVAAVLRVSNMTVYRLINAGELPALRVGKSYRIRQGDLDAYLTTGSVRADGLGG
jgi:excisionase family DNA binding protein